MPEEAKDEVLDIYCWGNLPGFQIGAPKNGAEVPVPTRFGEFSIRYSWVHIDEERTPHEQMRRFCLMPEHTISRIPVPFASANEHTDRLRVGRVFDQRASPGFRLVCRYFPSLR
jgi:hypothetical protein